MIDWEVRGRVAVATLNRPERRNALDAEHCDTLRRLLEQHGDLRAVVLTGAGSAFCAGADLGTRFDHDNPDTGSVTGDPFHHVLDRLLRSVVEFPAPVIAAVNGAALGAGTQLASVCDLRVAASESVFGIPAARIGILISGWSTQRLVRLIGQAHVTEMLLTARRYTADEALRIGLVHRVSGDPVVDAVAWADEIATLAPLSVQGHKRALSLIGAAGRLDADDAAEVAALIDTVVRSHDLREGIQAFNDKRTPTFEGH